MARLTKNERFDLYRNFKFRVFFGQSTDAVAGFSKVSEFQTTTEVVTHREEGDPSSKSRKSLGRSEFEAITLERGVTHDAEFEIWANRVWNYKNHQAEANQPVQEVSLRDFRRDIKIKMYNEAGQEVIAYQVYRCWVSEFQALPELDANAKALAIQSIKLDNEGWKQVEQSTELKEPEI